LNDYTVEPVIIFPLNKPALAQAGRQPPIADEVETARKRAGPSRTALLVTK